MRVAEAKKIVDMLADGEIEIPGMKLAADIMDMVEEGQQDIPDDAIIIEYHHPLLPFPDMTQAEIGDYVIIPLKNGTKARFDVTEIQGDIIRLDSHDCLIESRWNENNDTTGGIEESDLQEAVNKFFDEQIPDEIKKAVEPTMRDYMDGDTKRDFETLAFIPDASELFSDDNNEDYYEHIYRQMEFYKDRRNRIKFDKVGRPEIWWTASAYSGIATTAVAVIISGSSTYDTALTSYSAPICFQINAAKLPTHEIKSYFDTLGKTYYHQGFEDGIEEGAKSVKSWDKACYEQGLNDAWEAARIIYGMNKDTRLVTTAFVHYETVFDNYSASEAIAKIKEYEENQTNDEIRVGDEVISIRSNTKSMVWKISGDLYYLIGKNIAYYSDELKATGRHFDEIEEVLKQTGE